MKMRGSSYAFLVIMIVMLFIIILSLMLEEFESRLLPLLVSVIIFILSGVGLWHESLPGKEPGTVTKSDEYTEEQHREGWRLYIVHGGWVTGFLLGIWLLGFIIAVALFVLTYMKWLGTRWRISVICAIVTPIFVYLAFEKALEIDMYRGLLISAVIQ